MSFTPATRAALRNLSPRQALLMDMALDRLVWRDKPQRDINQIHEERLEREDAAARELENRRERYLMEVNGL